MELQMICGLLLFIIQFDGGSLLTMLTKGQMFVINDGESVSLDCQFYTDHFNLFDNPVIWQKAQRHETSQINIMGNVNPPFGPTKRFKVTFSPEPPRFRMDLKIDHVTLEDSGNYTCEVRGPHSTSLGYVTHYIFVRAPVEAMLITKENETDLDLDYEEPPRVIVFTEDEPSTLRCIARGGYPPPEVELFIGRRDITGTFGLSHSARLMGERGMRLMEYSTERWTHDFMARASDDGRKLKCVVTVPGVEPNISLIRMSVHFAPIIHCESNEAYLGDKNVFIRCRITARPTLSALFWILDENGTHVSEGEVINEYWTLVRDDDEEKIITLYMRRTKPSSYRSYRLVAENSVAVKTQEVKLVQKFRTTPKPVSTSRQSGPGSNTASQGGTRSGYNYINEATSTLSPNLSQLTSRLKISVLILVGMLTVHGILLR